MRFGGTIIVFALMLTGCGSPAATVESSPAAESSSASAPSSSSAAASTALLSLADACPKVQDALDAAFEDADPYDPGTFRQFAADIDALAAQTDPKGQNMLEELAAVSRQTSTALAGPDMLSAQEPWFTEMDRVTRVCEEQGAPLR